MVTWQLADRAQSRKSFSALFSRTITMNKGSVARKLLMVIQCKVTPSGAWRRERLRDLGAE